MKTSFVFVALVAVLTSGCARWQPNTTPSPEQGVVWAMFTVSRATSLRAVDYSRDQAACEKLRAAALRTWQQIRPKTDAAMFDFEEPSACRRVRVSRGNHLDSHSDSGSTYWTFAYPEPWHMAEGATEHDWCLTLRQGAIRNGRPPGTYGDCQLVSVEELH